MMMTSRLYVIFFPDISIFFSFLSWFLSLRFLQTKKYAFHLVRMIFDHNHPNAKVFFQRLSVILSIEINLVLLNLWYLRTFWVHVQILYIFFLRRLQILWIQSVLPNFITYYVRKKGNSIPSSNKIRI